MFPTIIDFGHFAIHSYGVMMALGFLLSWQIAGVLSRKNGRSVDELSNLLFLLMVSGIIGARIYYVVQFWDEQFAGNLSEIIRIDHGGLVFYGGLIASIISFIVYCLVKKISVLGIGDILVSVLPLGHAFGRIGCFLNGCCYGNRTESMFGVKFPPGSPAYMDQLEAGLISKSSVEALPVLPTQIFEAVLNTILSALLILLYVKTKGKYRGLSVVCYLLGYGIVRICGELLRGDVRAGGIVISCALISASILIYLLFVNKSIKQN